MDILGDIIAYSIAVVVCGAMLWRMLTDTDDKYPPYPPSSEFNKEKDMDNEYMKLWKQKICEVGRNLSRSKGMCKYHQGELQYCDIDEAKDIIKLIENWEEQENEDEKELDDLVAELKEHWKNEKSNSSNNQLIEELEVEIGSHREGTVDRDWCGFVDAIEEIVKKHKQHSSNV